MQEYEIGLQILSYSVAEHLLDDLDGMNFTLKHSLLSCLAIYI